MRILSFLLLPVSTLLLTQCAGGPSSTGPSRLSPHQQMLAAERNLVDLRVLLPDAVFDLRYRTRENVAWQPVYPQDMPCLIHVSTGRKLQAAARELRAKGYRLKVWDAWRPPEVQLTLHEHGGYTGMFTDPSLMWSRHCSGTAVDLTLTDARGRELEMPTPYDTGGPEASFLYTGKDEKVRRRLLDLQSAMLRAGFTLLDTEWWHFDDAEYNDAPVPPVVFAHELGVALPKVQPPRPRRSY